MNLSIEAKVAAVVAAGFAALTIGAIAQEDSRGQTGRPSGSDPINRPAINTQISRQGDTAIHELARVSSTVR